jgi:hypothetical protein
MRKFWVDALQEHLEEESVDHRGSGAEGVLHAKKTEAGRVRSVLRISRRPSPGGLTASSLHDASKLSACS